jgi:hypothetical protein
VPLDAALVFAAPSSILHFPPTVNLRPGMSLE